MKTILGLAALLILTGCTTALYTYQHRTPEGSVCSLTIDSERDVRGAADIVIDSDCSVAVEAQDLGGSGTWAPVVNELIKKLPGVD